MNLDLVIDKHSKALGLDFNLVKAICQVESGFEPNSARYERLFSYIFKPNEFISKGNNNINVSTETMFQMTSWGPMQIMGSVARERGFLGFLPTLCQPDLGIYFGCKHLKTFILKHKNLDDAIASYNAGSPRRDSEGKYVNQKYVDLVNQFMNSYRSEH